MILLKKHLVTVSIFFTFMMTFNSFAMAYVCGARYPKAQEQNVNVLHTVEAKLQNLKNLLNLDLSQNSAWNTWSSEVISEVKKQHEDDQKMSKDWVDDVSDNLSTPEKLAHQEEHLRYHIGRMENQLLRIESARKNTTAFYGTLNKNQQTIFDLFWKDSAFHHIPTKQ